MPSPRSFRTSSAGFRSVGLFLWPITLLAGLASAACMPAGSYRSPTVTGGASWVSVTPPGAGVQLAMPKPPQLEASHGRTSDGGRITTTTGETQTPTVLYRFVVSDFEGGIDGNAIDTLDDLVGEFIDSSSRAEVRSSGPVDVQGFPGTELVLYHYDEEIVIRSRHWVGKRRAYIFMAATPARDESANRPFIDHYFSSIRFDPADAPAPNGVGTFDPNHWSSIYPPDDDFAVQLPGDVRMAQQTRTVGDDSVEGRVYFVQRPDSQVSFGVHVLHFDEGPPPTAFADMERAVTARGFTVRDRRTTHRNGYPGQAVSYVSTRSVAYEVYVVTQHRLYIVSFSAPLSEEASLVELRQRFFRSLRIL